MSPKGPQWEALTKASAGNKSSSAAFPQWDRFGNRCGDAGLAGDANCQSASPESLVWGRSWRAGSSLTGDFSLAKPKQGQGGR